MLAHPIVSRVVITLARSPEPEPEVVINVTTIRVRSERPGTKQFQDTPPRRRFTVQRQNETVQEELRKLESYLDFNGYNCQRIMYKSRGSATVILTYLDGNFQAEKFF